MRNGIGASLGTPAEALADFFVLRVADCALPFVSGGTRPAAATIPALNSKIDARKNFRFSRWWPNFIERVPNLIERVINPVLDALSAKGVEWIARPRRN